MQSRDVANHKLASAMGLLEYLPCLKFQVFDLLKCTLLRVTSVNI